MKKWSAGLALVVLLILVLVPAAGAAAMGPAEKATGSAGFSEPNGPQSYVEFVVREAGASDAGSGEIRTWDVTGFWYVVDVEYVKVEGNMAYAAGPITASSNSDLVDMWFSGAALDGGEPGVDVDALWGTLTTMDEAVPNVHNRVKPLPRLDITSGNVQVHSYQ